MVKLSTIRILVLLAKKALHIEKWDVKTNFLHWYLEDQNFNNVTIRFRGIGKGKKMLCRGLIIL